MVHVRANVARCFVIASVASLVLVTSVPQVFAQASIAERRAQLEAELARIESLIQEQRVYLNEKQQERTSLERDVAILDSQIETAQLNIQYRNIAIGELSTEIADKG